MKKLFLLSALLFSPLFALPLGNPMDASLYRNGLLMGGCYENRCCDPCDPCFNWCDAWSIRAGFYGDYNYNRHMRTSKKSPQPRRKIDDFEIFTNAGYLALNICDRLDVFTTLGTTTIDFKGNQLIFLAAGAAPFAPFDRIRAETDNHFSWSVGGRLTLWDCDCFYFGLEAQYFQTHPRVDVIEEPDDFLIYPDKTMRMKYHDWQVGLGASYYWQIGCSGVAAVPYVGVTWSGSRTKFSHGSFIGEDYEFDRFRNDNLWGYAVGTTLTFCEAAGITVEGRFGDQKGISVLGEFRF